MTKIRVTKEFNFEMAHALWNYEGACRNIHGHSYKLFVTLLGTPIDNPGDTKFGMVLDFKDLKEMIMGPVIEYFDHSLLLYHEEDKAVISSVGSLYKKVHVVDFQPTCENMVLVIVEKIRKVIGSGLELSSVKLYETATSFAEWYAEDNL